MTDVYLTSLTADTGVTAGSDRKLLADLAIAGGTGALHLNRNSTAAANPPLQMTDGAAGVNGAFTSWYTKPLAAGVTIAGAITASLWVREAATNNNVAPTIRIERCSANGTPLATIVSETTNHGAGEAATTAAGATDSIAVTAANVIDTAVAAGERLRISLWIDDASDQGGTGAMATGGQGEMWVNGPVGSQGQARIAFAETLAFTPTLLAAYSFDEASGNAIDVTGQGRDFAVAGNLGRTAAGAGHTGKALLATNTATEPGPTTMFGQTPTRTVAMWVKVPTDYTGWIWEYHDNTLDTGFWGLLRLSGAMGFRARNAAGTIAFASTPNTADNAWHHWAGTYDGTNVRTYLDGTLVATVALANGIDAAQPDLIRMFTTVVSGVAVDDLRVYDGVLSQTEIATIRDTPVTGAPAADISGTLVAALSAQTAALAGAAKTSGSSSSSISPQTSAMVAAAKTSGSLSGTLATQVVAAIGAAKASGNLPGLLQAQISALAGTSKAAGALAGSLAPQTSSSTGEVTNVATLAATLAAQVASLTGSARATSAMAMSLAAMTANLTGQVQVLSAQGSLAGTLPPMSANLAAAAATVGSVVADLQAMTANASAVSTAIGTLAGALAAQSITLIAAAEVSGRDIIVVIGPSERPGVTIESSSSTVAVELDATERTTIEQGTDGSVIQQGETARTTIGIGNMDKQWRTGSKQFIDFVITLFDPTGDLDLAEVETMPLSVAVTQTSDAPARDSAAWIAPSVPITATAVDDRFKVSVMHMHEATAKGPQWVWVKFGPTPEEPIYLAVTFVVL